MPRRARRAEHLVILGALAAAGVTVPMSLAVGALAATTSGVMSASLWLLALCLGLVTLTLLVSTIPSSGPVRTLVRSLCDRLVADDGRSRHDAGLLDRHITSEVRSVGKKVERLPDRLQMREELGSHLDGVVLRLREERRSAREDFAHLLALHSMLGDDSWRIPHDLEPSDASQAAELLEHLMVARPHTILHHGPSSVTTILGLGARKIGVGHVVAIPSNSYESARAHRDLDVHDLRSVVTVLDPGATHHAASRSASIGTVEMWVVAPPASSLEVTTFFERLASFANSLAPNAPVFFGRADLSTSGDVVRRLCSEHRFVVDGERRHGRFTSIRLRRPTSTSRRSGRYVVVKGRHGMGDRIEAVVSATLYAEQTGRELVIDWNDPAYNSGRAGSVYGALFDAPRSADLPLESLIGASVHPAAWRDHLTSFRGVDLSSSMPRHLGRAVPPRDDVDEDVVVVSRRSETTAFSLTPQLMTPSLVIRQEINRFAAEHLDGRPVLGVQVRHGNGEFLLRPPDLGWFTERIDEYLATDEHAAVFLATDAFVVQEAMKERYESLVVVEKWFPESGSGPMHQNEACPDRFQNAVDAVMDLWLLARCDQLLLSPGIFGRNANRLSELDDDRIDVYPHRVHATVTEKSSWRDIR